RAPAVLEDRAQREEPRAALRPPARAVPRSRHPPVRARDDLGRRPRRRVRAARARRRAGSAAGGIERRRVRAPVRTIAGHPTRRSAMAEDGKLDRREFLRRSAVTGVSLSVLPLIGAAPAEPPRVRRRVTLGRTGLRVGDIGLGSSRLAGDEALVRHALDRGIDYFDTAEDYTSGASEETIGRALKGVRDKVTLASKVAADAHDSVADLFRA